MLLSKLKRHKIYNEKQAFFPNIHFPPLYFPWYSTCVSKGCGEGSYSLCILFSGKRKKTSDFFTVGDVVKKTITSSPSQSCCHILYLQVTGNHKHWRSKEKTTKERCYMSGKEWKENSGRAKERKIYLVKARKYGGLVPF